MYNSILFWVIVINIGIWLFALKGIFSDRGATDLYFRLVILASAASVSFFSYLLLNQLNTNKDIFYYLF